MRWRCWAAALAVSLGLAPAATPALAQRTTPEGVARGKELFLAECAGCHGANGDGKGLADPAMQPQPRDLTSGKFKVRSTSAQTPATNAEILASITNGIPGTAMPAFRFLDQKDREALTQFVASLGKLKDDDASQAVVFPPAPEKSPKLIEEGKVLYIELGCPACHGELGRGDGAAAPYLKDEWGSKTPPRNLRSDPMKGGDTDRDLYLRFAIGMPGTPMPAYADTVSAAELWALVFYVRSLHEKPPAPPSDPVAWGKELVAAKHCTACHMLDGRGGKVGLPLAQIARQRSVEWIATFLVNPRVQPKIHLDSPYRMPDLGLSEAEAGAIAKYLVADAGDKSH